MIVINGKTYYGIIYKITNKINDKVYIGQSQNTFDERYNYDVEKYTHNNDLKKDIKKYGIDNFEINKIIDLALSEKELNEKEIYWIEYYDSFNNGYNNTLGGQGEYTKNRITDEVLYTICNLWNKNPLYTINDISLETGFGDGLIKRILERGSELELCDYDKTKCDERKSYDYRKKYYSHKVLLLWNNNKNIIPNEIAKKLNIDKNFVVKILKENEEKGLCIYNAKERINTNYKNKKQEKNEIERLYKNKIIELWEINLLGTGEIAEKLKIKQNDVLNILKNATEEGLCFYSAEEAIKRGIEKRGE